MELSNEEKLSKILCYRLRPRKSPESPRGLRSRCVADLAPCCLERACASMPSRHLPAWHKARGAVWPWAGKFRKWKLHFGPQVSFIYIYIYIYIYSGREDLT